MDFVANFVVDNFKVRKEFLSTCRPVSNVLRSIRFEKSMVGFPL